MSRGAKPKSRKVKDLSRLGSEAGVRGWGQGKMGLRCNGTEDIMVSRLFQDLKGPMTVQCFQQLPQRTNLAANLTDDKVGT